MNISKIFSACVLSLGVVGCTSTSTEQAIKDAYQRGVADTEKHSLLIQERFEKGFCEAEVLANISILRQRFLSNSMQETTLFVVFDRNDDSIECLVSREDVRVRPVRPLNIHNHKL